jgi:hypothetical protein
VKIVDQVSAADEQDPLFAQGHESFADLKMECRRFAFVYAQLDDGNVGGGIYVPEDRPCSMIEPLGVIEFNLDRREQFLHPACQRRIAGRRVLHLKQFSREPAEIVDGSRRRGNGYPSFWNKPVSRDRQNRLRFGRRLSYPAPCRMVKKLEWIDIARLAVFSMLFKLPSLKVP